METSYWALFWVSLICGIGIFVFIVLTFVFIKKVFLIKKMELFYLSLAYLFYSFLNLHQLYYLYVAVMIIVMYQIIHTKKNEQKL